MATTMKKTHSIKKTKAANDAETLKVSEDAAAGKYLEIVTILSVSKSREN